MGEAKPGKEHKEKKHKEKKHKEHKQQPDSAKKDKRDKKDKHQQQQDHPQQQQQQQHGTAAVPGSSSSSLPSPPLPFEGLGLQQLDFSCPLDFAAAQAQQDEEVWVLRLPAGLPVSLLHGCNIHLPSEPPALSHLKGPAAAAAAAAGLQQQQQGEGHTPAQVIGHVALDGSDAATHDVYRYREVLQEDEFLVKRLRVAGPATGTSYKPSQHLKSVKVARLVSISDDVRTVSKQQLAAAVAAGAELGPAAWDGKLPPRTLRTRIGGWQVVGQRQQQQQQQRRKKKGDSSSSGDADDEDGSSDEEFHEVVFENSAGAAAATGGSSDDDSDDDRQQQQHDPEQRFYSSSSDDEGHGSAAGLKGKWDVLNERFSLGKFLLKLPVQPDMAAAQRAVYPSMQQQQQQPGDSSSSDEDASPDSDSDTEEAPAAAAAAGSSKKAAAGAKAGSDDDNSSSDEEDGKPFSDDEADAGAAAMDVDGDSSEGWDDDEDDKPAKQQQQQAVIDSGSWGGVPPRPLRELVENCLGWAEQQQLAAMAGNKALQRRMTNVAQLVRLDWGDVCAQLDMDAMSDYQTEMLLRLLQLREQFSSAYDSEGEALQLALLLPPGGKSSTRPRFMDTDAGYAHYQAADARPVLPAVPNAQQLDEQWAALLRARGAGKLATFVDTQALRARGFAWDNEEAEAS
ncbi:hypothetical protein OEZ86_005184 [Tetradesmus obliquus]|nr:hypothetical protein OEZ86_005184 [Tetradesmus obliquus]